MIRAADLRERVSIRALTSTSDGKGGFVEAFSSELVTGGVWARVEAISSGERIQGAQQENARRYDVTIRYLSTVTPVMRLVLDDSRVLKIEGSRDPDLRRRWLILACTEDNGSGA